MPTNPTYASKFIALTDDRHTPIMMAVAEISTVSPAPVSKDGHEMCEIITPHGQKVMCRESAATICHRLEKITGEAHDH